MSTEFTEANVCDEAVIAIRQTFGEHILNMNNYRQPVHDHVRVAKGTASTSEAIAIVFELECQGEDGLPATMRIEEITTTIKAMTTAVSNSMCFDHLQQEYEPSVDRVVSAFIWEIPTETFTGVMATDMVAAAKLVG